jgi:hypothetical protein
LEMRRQSAKTPRGEREENAEHATLNTQHSTSK